MGNEKNDISFIKNVPDSIQICNFGSSHGYYGFNYENYSKKYICFNFALPSQTILYDYKILENYRNKIQEGCIVFILISHFSFFGKPEVEDINFESKNRRYYRFLRKDLIERYDIRTDFYENYFPSLTSGNLLKLVRTLLEKGQDSWNFMTNQDEAVKHGLLRYKSFIIDRLDANGSRLYKTEAITSLYKMIKLCQELKAIPILVTTPYLNEYSEVVKKNDPAFYNDFYGIINKVIRDTKVKYYDYSEDKRFVKNYSLFMDTDHLNRIGAELFTKILIEKEILEK